MKKFHLVVALTWLALTASAVNSVTVAWDASADPAVTGYSIYYGVSSLAYTNVINAGATLSISISNLVPGATYFLAATDYTAAGLESGYSGEITYNVPALKPPTIDPLRDLNIATNSGPHAVHLTGITSGSTNASSISINAYASNTNLVQSLAVNYTSPNTTGTLTVTPSVTGFGSSVVTVIVSNSNTSATTSFMLVVGTGTPPIPPVIQPPVLK